MKRALALTFVILVVLLSVSCRSARHRGPASTQQDFGVDMAKMNLWREALFRFKRAVQINPTDAMAHNNLAVAYEANGDFDSAAKEYREAMRLDKSNQYIQKNYSRFVEFTSRNKKRQRATTPAPKAASTSDTAPGTVPATTTAPATASEGPATPAQPTGTAPAAIPPEATAVPSQPPVPTDTAAPQAPPPPPVKPPGELE